MKAACLIACVFFFVSTVPALAEHPKPNISGQQCGDNPWATKGHWMLLGDGQYGAECLNKHDQGYKWKIAKREGNQIIPVWCGYFEMKATTEQLNQMLAAEGGKFVQMPIKDIGEYETVGFWIYK